MRSKADSSFPKVRKQFDLKSNQLGDMEPGEFLQMNFRKIYFVPPTYSSDEKLYYGETFMDNPMILTAETHLLGSGKFLRYLSIE